MHCKLIHLGLGIVQSERHFLAPSRFKVFQLSATGLRYGLDVGSQGINFTIELLDRKHGPGELMNCELYLIQSSLVFSSDFFQRLQ